MSHYPVSWYSENCSKYIYNIFEKTCSLSGMRRVADVGLIVWMFSGCCEYENICILHVYMSADWWECQCLFVWVYVSVFMWFWTHFLRIRSAQAYIGVCTCGREKRSCRSASRAPNEKSSRQIESLKIVTLKLRKWICSLSLCSSVSVPDDLSLAVCRRYMETSFRRW